MKTEPAVFAQPGNTVAAGVQNIVSLDFDGGLPPAVVLLAGNAVLFVAGWVAERTVIGSQEKQTALVAVDPDSQATVAAAVAVCTQSSALLPLVGLLEPVDGHPDWQ